MVKDGYQALKPHRKGRLPKAHKKTKKQLKHLTEKSENDRLREKLARTKRELHEARLDRDILRNSLALFGSQSPKKAQIVDRVRAEQTKLPKSQQYKVGKLLKKVSLAFMTSMPG